METQLLTVNFKTKFREVYEPSRLQHNQSKMNGQQASNNSDSRRSSMVDSSGRFCSQPISGSPELLLGLCFDENHDTVLVNVDKASSLSEAAHPIDAFVRVVAVDEFGAELYRQKSTTNKGSNQPVFNYRCSIQLPRETVETCTVRVEIWSVTGILRRRQQLGAVAVGFNASSPDAQEHWQQMLQSAGITVSKWHPVQPPA